MANAFKNSKGEIIALTDLSRGDPVILAASFKDKRLQALYDDMIQEDDPARFDYVLRKFIKQFNKKGKIRPGEIQVIEQTPLDPVTNEKIKGKLKKEELSKKNNSPG